ncbi:hypothetical protein ACQ86N_08570 [Puia sp. P3]|uniref:hypothetical protein n=1 Tax=Puia sp. P3 TaxID=3423952 RepID=UPI003D66FFCA
MKKLAAVVVIVLGCRVARCQDVTGGVSPMVRDSNVVVVSRDTIREVSMATGWGSKADTVPRFNWSQGLPAWKQPFPYKSFLFRR